MIARLAPRRPRRHSPPSSRLSVGPLDGSVRSTSDVRRQPTFDEVIRSASAAARAPFAPSVRPSKLPDHLRRRPDFDTLVRARALRLRQRDVSESVVTVPAHVADALRSRLST
jgi:hypothetical protein